ncbi:1-acyl-sn-glycerol-3-phosphate acyltransferase [Corynebacterium yudongzhengii]|uniref:1-acyl-sn-glycerol-3-phosphate acyltransferase n=2 Tax=Corynebacterium yudongzhengii TaxID=2080740 RepID=A0A2U1T886_9CORY|nr:lysophospholipid acyltransferase family protein [Corynebacterium yudongzhengii]AWB83061.1 1-acyl-sn-glycerol-3-phosphate acyltransferase [Corynebacterium yudongzhengii]PWC02220.1 1-acyl-sn-glycerol-3-phosphate acyltransferase [Corynebacterium yudongzhengii]
MVGQFRVPAGLPEVPEHPREPREFPYGRIILPAIRKILRLQGMRITCVGAENLPTTGGALIASNHTNYLDMCWVGVPAQLRGKRLVRYMTKKEVFDIPVVGAIMRAMKQVPVDRFAGRSSIAEAVRYLRAGHLVGVFPEATISRSFELKGFKTGAVRIAAEAHTPLIPLVSWGGQRTWTKGGKKHLGRHHFPVRVHVGAPVDTSGTPEEATARLKAAMQELLDDARHAYEAEYGPYEGGESWRPAALGGGALTLAQADELDAQYRAEKKRRHDEKQAAAEKKAAQKAARKARGLWGRVTRKLSRS